MTDTEYVFEGTRQDSELDRLRLLESVFDPGSQRAPKNRSARGHALPRDRCRGRVCRDMDEQSGGTDRTGRGCRHQHTLPQ
jgi:hypothetical protein